MFLSAEPVCTPEVEVLHRPGGDEGLLRVVQHIRLSVHSGLVVGHIHAHGLLAHSRLIGVSRGLVVVREGDDGGTHPKDHGWMDLTMCEVGCAGNLGVVPCIGQVSYVHGYHGGLLLLCVQVPVQHISMVLTTALCLWVNAGAPSCQHTQSVASCDLKEQCCLGLQDLQPVLVWSQHSKDDVIAKI